MGLQIIGKLEISSGEDIPFAILLQNSLLSSRSLKYMTRVKAAIVPAIPARTIANLPFKTA